MINHPEQERDPRPADGRGVAAGECDVMDGRATTGPARPSNSPEQLG